MKSISKIYIANLILLFSISSYSQTKPNLILVHEDGFDSINSLAYSSDGKRLITCVVNGIIWDISNGNMIQTIPANGIGCAAFSPDNNMIIGGICHLFTRIWDVETRKLLYSKQGEGDQNSFDYPLSILGVSFLPNGQEALIIDQYGHIDKWDFSNNKTQFIADIDMSPHQQIHVSIDGNQLFVSPYLISIPERRILHTFKHSTLLNFTNNKVFSLRVSGGSLQLFNLEEYDADTYEKINEYPSFVNYGRVLKIHPDGRYVLAGRTDEHDEETRIIDAHTAKVCKTFQNAKGEDEDIDQIVFSPDGKQVALVSGNRIKLYDVSDLTSSVKEAEALGR